MYGIKNNKLSHCYQGMVLFSLHFVNITLFASILPVMLCRDAKLRKIYYYIHKKNIDMAKNYLLM